jgi:hypothetical protein
MKSCFLKYFLKDYYYYMHDYSPNYYFGVSMSYWHLAKVIMNRLCLHWFMSNTRPLVWPYYVMHVHIVHYQTIHDVHHSICTMYLLNMP